MNGMIKKTKAHRDYRPIELWSKKYYTDKVQPTVTEELSTQNASNRSVRLKVIREKTRIAFEEDSSEVHQEIAAEIQNMKSTAKAAENDGSEEPQDLAPEDIQQ